MKGFFQNIVSNDEYLKKENVDLKAKLCNIEEENRLLKNCCLPKSKFSKSVTSEEPFDNKFDQFMSDKKISSKYSNENNSLKDFKLFLAKNLFFTNNISSNDVDNINNLFIKENDWENNKSVFLLKQNILERNMLRMIELLNINEDIEKKNYFNSLSNEYIAYNQSSLQENDFEKWVNDYCKDKAFDNDIVSKNVQINKEKILLTQNKLEPKKEIFTSNNIQDEKLKSIDQNSKNINIDKPAVKKVDNKLNKLLYLSDEEEDEANNNNTLKNDLNINEQINLVDKNNGTKELVPNSINNKVVNNEKPNSQTFEQASNNVNNSSNSHVVKQENTKGKNLYEWDIEDDE